MSVTDTIAGGFKATLVSKIVEIGVNGLLILLLTRVFLTTEEYGLLYLAISIFGMAVFFSRMGFAKSAARYVTEYRDTDPSVVRAIVRRSLLFNLLSIAIVSAVVVVFREPIVAGFGEPELLSLLSLGVLFIVAQTLRSYAYFLCQGFNRVTWSAILSIVSNLGIFVFAIGFLSLGFGIAGALLGYIVGYALGATVGLVVLYRWLSQLEPAADATDDAASAETEPRDDDGSITRRLLEYSVPLTVTGASSIMFKRVDIVLVGAFLTPVAVAYYTLAKQLTEFVAAPASSLGFALAPTFGESKSNDDVAQAAAIYETTFEHNLLFYVPAATGMLLVADPAIRHVFGEEYLGAIPIVQVLSVFVVLESINKLTNGALDFLGRARHRALSKGGAAIFNLGLNVVLIPTIGPTGAAVSTVISYAIMATVNLYLIHIELSLSVGRLARTTLTVCGIAAGMALAVVLALPYVSSVVTLLSTVLLGVAVWLTLAVGSGLLDPRWAVSQLN
ncbi:flippase [Salinadaptatus halalkaliphilus]|uniref:Flippase n=1 Tax=Salinadaptatus halalkaliphilus TaxID=2419781 RepID=A0A4S3TL79_9EURY|nr:flippase [Salinadaptatus halalkaliphilus]THE64909.1 flippase [Salinadaptatus halalkaliphilus]